MIRTDTEYAQAQSRLLDEWKRLAEHEASMKEAGLEPAPPKRAMDPFCSFNLQLKEEVETYERMQRGRFEPITNLAGLGQQLVGARIFVGISQCEFAKRLEVHESQVSRDERNEYREIMVDRAIRILEAIGAVELYSVKRSKSS